MEWSSIGIRGPDRASIGFWFWVPAITLLLLLSNYLAQIVESDNKTTEDSRIVHVSRNFYGVLRVKYEGSDPTTKTSSPQRMRSPMARFDMVFSFLMTTGNFSQQPITVAKAVLDWQSRYLAGWQRNLINTLFVLGLWDWVQEPWPRMVSPASTSDFTTSIRMF